MLGTTMNESEGMGASHYGRTPCGVGRLSE